jgi:Fe-S-cluster containining protein
MTVHPGEEELPAGDFSEWVDGMQSALRGESDSDVPCGTCTACCTASQFVHIAPDETDALAHIPRELLFPAPGLPRGHKLLGYDENGHCPMLRAEGCSIYEHRPRTCRTYDCRVFTAAGVDLDDPEKSLIAERTHRWTFSFPTEADDVKAAAVRAAARFLIEHSDQLPVERRPRHATELAVLAVQMHEDFLPAHE